MRIPLEAVGFTIRETAHVVEAIIVFIFRESPFRPSRVLSSADPFPAQTTSSLSVSSPVGRNSRDDVQSVSEWLTFPLSAAVFVGFVMYQQNQGQIKAKAREAGKKRA